MKQQLGEVKTGTDLPGVNEESKSIVKYEVNNYNIYIYIRIYTSNYSNTE